MAILSSRVCVVVAVQGRSQEQGGAIHLDHSLFVFWYLILYMYSLITVFILLATLRGALGTRFGSINSQL